MGKDYDKIEPAPEKEKVQEKETQETEKVTERVEPREIKPVPIKKKSLFKRAIIALTPEGGFKQLAHDTFINSIIPASKDMLYNASQGALNAIIYGGRNNGGNWINAAGRGAVAGARTSLQQRTNRVPYNQMGNSRNQQQIPTPKHQYTQIEHFTQADAEYVLATMRQYILDQGYVSVGDYYSISGADQTGISVSYVDNTIGWVDLTNARTVRNPSGYYIITLPPVVNV